MKTFYNKQIKRMKFLSPGCLFIFILLVSPTYSQSRVIGYYPEYNSTVVTPESIKFENLTNIIHAFAWPDTNGNIYLYSGMLGSSLVEEAHNADVKVSIAFGGAGEEQTENFAAVAVSSEKREHFVSEVIQLVSLYNYDGVDLDWEFPGTEEEKTGYTSLVKELREALDEVDSTLLLSMAVNPLGYYGQWSEYEEFVEYLDWVSIMGYDFHGSWLSHTGHNAPLYKWQSDSDGSIDESFKYLNGQRKIPAEKLVLGVAFYGKIYNSDGLKKSWEPLSDDVDVSSWKYSTIYDEVTGDTNYVYNWDTEAKVPYYVNTVKNRFITFDDTTSIRMKCEYALAKGMQGIMIWEITQDLIDGDDQPLLKQIGVSMGLVEPTAIEEFEEELATSFELFNNYPNPFNPTTKIGFKIPNGSFVTLKVYDALGREVEVLINKYLAAGKYETVFDASHLSSGIYFYTLIAEDFIKTKKMSLVK